VESNRTHPSLCRDCFQIFRYDVRCRNCNSPRIVSHANLLQLTIAHIDCDAFYASIEKRENPEIRNSPVIVGEKNRGVVTTCCYIARIDGVRSAMPIFQAKKLCPDAIIISPRMNHYKKISKSIKEILTTLSPAIEFISLDEAYIDFKGTRRLHGEAPAVKLAKISKQIETELGISISIGLSYNKFLSKIGSDLDKPRGFSIIGQSDAKKVLEDKPVSKILGVGKKTKMILEGNCINKISDLLIYEKNQLIDLLGSFGETLWFMARGIDYRRITPNKRPKSISCEKTLQTNQIDPEILTSFVWDLTEEISFRLKDLSLVAKNFKLKLKTANFNLLVRSITLENYSNSPEKIFQANKILLKKNIFKGPFRLVGITATNFLNCQDTVWKDNLFEQSDNQILAAEEAIDYIRSKFGKKAIIRGRSLKHCR